MSRFRTVFAYLPRYRWPLGLGVLSILVGQGLHNYAPQLLRQGFNTIEDGADAGLIDVGLVGQIALGYVVLMLARAFFLWSMRMYTIGASRQLEADLRSDFFAHLQSLDDTFYGQHRTGDLMSRATSDLEAVRSALGPAVMYITNSVISLAFAVGWMFYMDWVLTLVALVPLVGIAVLVRWSAPRIMSFSRSVQDAMGRLSTAGQENFAGVRVVKAYAREEREEERWDAISRDYVDASIGLAKVRGVMMGGITSLGSLGVLAILAYCGFSMIGMIAISEDIEIGELVAFQAYQVSLVWPMMAFGWVMAMFQRGAAALERIDAILESKPAVVVPDEPAALERLRGRLEVKGLSFEFTRPDSEVAAGQVERFGLHDISFDVAPGGTLAIVGRTGSGKSSLASLLAHRFPVPRDTIRYDEVDVCDLLPATLRDGLAVVPQDAFLFSQTIRDNVSFGMPETDDLDERVRWAAGIAALDKDVEGFPKGYETRVGERGVTLSGGQKQRVAIARAILRKPSVLILDDCLSAVDARTEHEILGAMREVIADCTTIIVSHRLSAVMEADEILVLEAGRIVARGTHDELVARPGYYADTWRRQKLEDELGVL